ncbi:hypothetical protein [Fimbriiglobus ruber]|uniref:Uncharacterized protein n=1 Tax=Fimbriiglobus ruber TaxID=1908690 RepID=A0A225D8V1_9BACT|nr:hypothetical protein [Fimbriiglobus ruber]OWK36074.1 hypothetical protein FRUB_08637 [Fimbriiglobus ruber]
MAKNTPPFEWIVTIRGNLDFLFRDRPDVSEEEGGIPPRSYLKCCRRDNSFNNLLRKHLFFF